MNPISELRISRQARDRLQFRGELFSIEGPEVAEAAGRGKGGGIDAARHLADNIYSTTGRLVPASDIQAAVLINEVLHALLRQHSEGDAGAMVDLEGLLEERLGNRLNETLSQFTDAFPPASVYQGYEPVELLLSGTNRGLSHRQIALQEMLLIEMANRNPSLESIRELFDNQVLKQTGYRDAVSLIEDFFSGRKKIKRRQGATSQSLIKILTAHITKVPDSLEGQLRYLLKRWNRLLDPELRSRIRRGVELVHAETVRRAEHEGFHGSQVVPDYRGQGEQARFSADQDWMRSLVLIAKNIFVWLEQLSQEYKREIRTLDQIPDEELDRLARRGFTGLWLIGLWERSPASQRIKQRMGQDQAAGSAYAVGSYEIAEELGGWEALRNLRRRAMQRGIRLAADMVPNHMSMDSRWVIELPERFLSLEHPPFASYSFDSPNLSDDPRVEIRLEDHYYDRTDAAVVFQRRDPITRETRYIYHGNDGTSLPWNDTAQLDYSKADVRETLIETIIHVATEFPIIRFDSAMALARKHIQRLWFPEPGTGEAIPSRSEHGMTAAEFEAAVPKEFWREVVDRLVAEAPDTLLLAEAFWLMEAYFVRTLGMHRVYNSAFMHMLREEENAKYRQLIKNTLEFDPLILKHHVNFMNNPDEKSAAEQFGKDDKYLGTCALLASHPGLPMFGHGQVEGLREKYGMEFRKPNLDEKPDRDLIRAHEDKILPILQRRDLFAGAENFCLFDHRSADSEVNEDVIAYTNRQGDDRALVMFNNCPRSKRGWIMVSNATLDKASGKPILKSLGQALSLPRSGYVVFRDCIDQKEYIRSCDELWKKGLFAELGAYEHHVFMDWRFVDGDAWKRVCQMLGGEGVDSVERVRLSVTTMRLNAGMKKVGES